MRSIYQSLNRSATVLSDTRHDPAMRVLIITGAGDRAFVAGADIAAMSEDEHRSRDWSFRAWAIV